MNEVEQSFHVCVKDVEILEESIRFSSAEQNSGSYEALRQTGLTHAKAYGLAPHEAYKAISSYLERPKYGFLTIR